MTDLELAICEAENNGEIDLDTRDIMLGILNESGRDYDPKVKDAGDKKYDLLKKIEAIESRIEKEEAAIDSYKRRSDRTGNKDYSSIKDRERAVKKLKDDADDLRRKFNRIEFFGIDTLHQGLKDYCKERYGMDIKNNRFYTRKLYY